MGVTSGPYIFGYIFPIIVSNIRGFVKWDIGSRVAACMGRCEIDSALLPLSRYIRDEEQNPRLS